MLHITFSKYDCIIVHKAYYLFTCTCVSINSFHSHSHSHIIKYMAVDLKHIHIITNLHIMCNNDNLNKLDQFRKCSQKYNKYIVHFFSENFGGQK